MATIFTGSGQVLNTDRFFPTDSGASFNVQQHTATIFRIQYTSGAFNGAVVQYSGQDLLSGGSITFASLLSGGSSTSSLSGFSVPFASLATTTFASVAGGPDQFSGSLAAGGVVRGFDGDDTLEGGGSLFGGEGSDVLRGTTGAIFDGGPGVDSVSFFGTVTSGLTIDIRAPNAKFVSIERFFGTIRNDRFFGSADGDFFSGSGANSNGGDLALGFDGADTLEAGSGGVNSLLGGDGDDSILGGSSIDLLFGDAGNDFISGGGDVDYIEGGAGADTIFAGSSDDPTVSAGFPYEIVLAGAGDDLVTTLAPNQNYFEGGDGDDSLVGSDFTLPGMDIADYLFGDNGNDTIRGGGGNDAIIGSNYKDVGDANQRDLLFGGAGNDFVLQGLHGSGRLEGESGDDSIVGASGSDTIVFGRGNDFGYGQGGDDVFEISVADIGPGEVDGIVDLFNGADVIRLVGIPRANVVFSSVDVGGAPFGVITIATTGGTHSIFVTAGTAALVEARTEFISL